MITQQTALWWRRMAIMIIKELKQLYRDPVLLVIIAYFFTADVYLAGDGAKITLYNGAIVVIDHDHSAASRELIYHFRPPYFDFKGELTDAQSANKLLNNGDVLAILDIPNDFQHDLLQGKPAQLQLQLDASNMSLATLMSRYTAELVGRFGQDYSLARLGLSAEQLQAAPIIEDRHRVLYNPNQTDSWFMSISELLTVITMLSMMLPAAAAVREKERGTIEQLMVSPLTPIQILLPKVLAMGLVILLAVAVCLYGVMRPIFHVPIQGNIGLFFAVTTLYVFATSGIGLYIASISRNLGQVSMLVLLIIMPIILLSGAWTPPEAMPTGLRYAMYISPLYYFIEMGYGILLKGAGLETLWDSLLGLALLGCTIFSVGIWRFRTQ
jgi:ABC-2 type transport system permease protein